MSILVRTRRVGYLCNVIKWVRHEDADRREWGLRQPPVAILVSVEASSAAAASASRHHPRRLKGWTTARAARSRWEGRCRLTVRSTWRPSEVPHWKGSGTLLVAGGDALNMGGMVMCRRRGHPSRRVACARAEGGRPLAVVIATSPGHTRCRGDRVWRPPPSAYPPCNSRGARLVGRCRDNPHTWLSARAWRGGGEREGEEGMEGMGGTWGGEGGGYPIRVVLVS